VIPGIVNGTVRADSIDIKSSRKILDELHTTSLKVEKRAIYGGCVIIINNNLVKEIIAS
jgi:cytoskeletal protein CcmA (bactofilin family)